jgi:hypothetical protein
MGENHMIIGEKAVRAIDRVVVMLHPGQLKEDNVYPITLTDFNHDNDALDKFKQSFIEAGGACVYDGHPQDLSKENNT